MFSIKNQIVFGICILIIWLVLMPNPIHLNIPHFDKFGHVSAFALMTYVIAKILTIRKAVFIVLILSTLLEYTQTFIPTRGAQISDVVANCAGIIFMWIFHCKFKLLNCIRRKT